MLLHAHWESFHSPQHQPAFERRENRSCGLLQKRQLFGLLARGANHHPAQAVAMTIEKFRGRMDDHVRSQRDRMLEVWGHECIVDDQLDFSAMADLSDGFDVA